MQLCFTKHPFRRTVPLQLHEERTPLLMPPRSSPLPSFSNSVSLPKPSRRALSHFTNQSTLVLATVSAAPVAVTASCPSLVRSPTAHHLRHQDSRIEHFWVLSRYILTKAAPVRPHSHKNPALTSPGTPNPSTSTPTLQPQVSTTQMGTHTACSSATHKRSASTALAGTHSAIGADPRAGRGLFPEPRPVVLPVVRFGLTKPAGLGHLHNADSDLVHHQFRLCVLQWNPGPARRNPTQIIAATCGRIHAVISQEASDHVPHVSDQFIAYTGNTDLAVLLNKDTFKPNPAVYAFQEAS